MTNKTPHAPYRGAGRPEAVFVMDRLLDMLARELGLDPAELRRRNLVRPDEMPYDVGILYRDGIRSSTTAGDFPDGLAQALERGRTTTGLRARRSRRSGRAGSTGASASPRTSRAPGSGRTRARRCGSTPPGKVLVATGACSQGQGHETAFAQIAADALGVDLEDVTVVGGDTDAIPFGMGTFASRSTVLAGNADRGLRRGRARRSSSARLRGCSRPPRPISRWRRAGCSCAAARAARSRSRSIVRASLPTFQAPAAVEPDFEATTYQGVPTVTYASAVHVAVVEVDPETGRVRILRYVVAHDCGRVINPMLVDGQIHGGVAQGVGGGLGEEIVYDAAGQLLTGSLMDYALPRADELPFIETVHLEHPSPAQPP